MLAYGLYVNHVFRQQKGLLHGVSYIPSRALLEVLDGGVTKEKSPIKLHAWVLG